MRNGVNVDYGTCEIVGRAVYSSGAPGSWTIKSPLICDIKDLDAALAVSTVTLTTAADVLNVTVTNAAITSVDWSGLIQVTLEKQLA
jgi:hypothetical protein